MDTSIWIGVCMTVIWPSAVFRRFRIVILLSMFMHQLTSSKALHAWCCHVVSWYPVETYKTSGLSRCVCPWRGWAQILHIVEIPNRNPKSCNLISVSQVGSLIFGNLPFLPYVSLRILQWGDGHSYEGPSSPANTKTYISWIGAM